MFRHAVLLSALLSVPLLGCAPLLRASWHFEDVGTRPPVTKAPVGEAWPGQPPPSEPDPPKIPPTVYLSLTNLEPTTLTVQDLTVNGRRLERLPGTLHLAPGQIRVIDLGPFRCTLPLALEFSNGWPWRHRVRGIPWSPSAPPENIEEWCQ